MLVKVGSEILSLDTIVRISSPIQYSEETFHFDIICFSSPKIEIYTSGCELWRNDQPIKYPYRQGGPPEYWNDPAAVEKYQALAKAKIIRLHDKLVELWSKHQSKIPIIE